MRNIVLSVVCCLISIWVLGQDFEVAPAKLIYACEPGQIQTKTVFIKNHSVQKQQFTLTVGEGAADSLGHKRKTGDKLNTEKSCKDWITVSPSFLDINPNESKEVRVIMQVPPGQNATKWAMLFVTATEEQTSTSVDKQMKSGIKVKPRIGIRVIQSPKSNINYKGLIADLKEITHPNDSVRTFQATVINAGDKVLDSKIYLVLSDLQTAKEIKNKPIKKTIYPTGADNVVLTLPKNIPQGKYSLAAILDYGNNSTLEAVQMNIEVK